MLVRKEAVVTRIEGKRAVLRLENGDQLTLSRDDLFSPGETPAVGARFVVQVLPKAEAQLTQDELARSLLNTLLSQEDVSRSPSTAGVPEEGSENAESRSGEK